MNIIHPPYPLVGRIESINKKFTRDGRPFLIININKREEGIFVFDNKVSASKWGKLKEGVEYTFMVEDSSSSNLVLVDFNEEIFI